uniref:C2H2-type domain-containing protein n=1 Tax=Syphacia muris TaxID=451379 RepID=A0A0N5ASP4_9BILA
MSRMATVVAESVKRNIKNAYSCAQQRNKGNTQIWHKYIKNTESKHRNQSIHPHTHILRPADVSTDSASALELLTHLLSFSKASEIFILSEWKQKQTEAGILPIEGVYRQIESVVFVDESGETNFDNTDHQLSTNGPIEQLLLLQKTSILLWKLVDYNFETEIKPAALKSDISYFFCLCCAQRYPCLLGFLQHISVSHRNIHTQLAAYSESQLQSLPTLIIMNNFSLCKGEPSREDTLNFTLQTLASSSPNFEQLIQRNSSLDVDMNHVFQHVSMNFLNGIADLSGHISEADTNNSTNSSSSSVAGTVPVVSSTLTVRNTTKTLKCPKCNWHYKYQETLEIHMKEKHSDNESIGV